MTEREENLLIDLGVQSKMLADIANEFIRLRGLTDNQTVQSIMGIISDGLLNLPHVQSTPCMSPMQMEDPDRIFKGDGGMVSDLHAMIDGGAYSTVWKTDDFMQRLAFLRHGCINLIIHGNRIPPLSIRNDIDGRFFFTNNEKK